MNAPNDARMTPAPDRKPESRASSPTVEDVSSPVLSIEETPEIPGLRRVRISLPKPQLSRAPEDNQPQDGAPSDELPDAADTSDDEGEDETEALTPAPDASSTEAPASKEPAAEPEAEPERPLILIRRVPAQGSAPHAAEEDVPASTEDSSSGDWFEDFTESPATPAPEETAARITEEAPGEDTKITAPQEAAPLLQDAEDLPSDDTDRITVPAGFGLPPILESQTEDEAEDADDEAITIDAGLREGSAESSQGIVHHGAYSDRDLKSDEPIEIRRVMSLVEAVVQEQKLRSQDPLNLQGERSSVIETDTVSESSATSETGDAAKGTSIKEEASEQNTPASKNIAEKLFHLPFGLDQQWEQHQARVQKLSEESNSKLEAWLHLPFELKPFPRNFAQQSEGRQRSIRKLWRLEAETSGLMLTSGLLYLFLSIIWLLLPAHFLSIFKAQAAGQFIYQILEAGLVLLLPLTLFARYQPYPLSRIFGPVMPSFSQNLTGFLIGIPLGVLIVSLQNLSTVIFPSVYSSNLLRFMYMPRSLRPGSEIIQWLLVILMPSLLEELFFRGNLFTGLYRQGYKVGAFAISSLLYALLQQDPLLYIPFSFALILCFVRRFSASLFTSILSHLGFRITIFFLYRNYPIFVRSMPLSTQASQAAIYASAVSLVVSVAVLIVLISFLRSLKSPLQQGEFSDVHKPRRPLLKNPGLRTGLLLYLLSYLIRLAANN